ncbi:MAG: DUF4956 domain-containing protein [Oscillospiraceae bacterium]|nr:DUF4956 domain-containing protein [Oscillospiraceae bacterium]
MFNSVLSGSITLVSFLICTASSLVLGLLSAAIFFHQNKSTRSFALTLAMLPAIVELVIMLVNGNIGAGLAVAGTFGLVRFRSVPGKAQEITALFLSVALGLATGMGYVAIAFLFFVIMAAAMLLLSRLNFGGSEEKRRLKITIPEDMNYDTLFDDLFQKYTKGAELTSVRTTNLGTLYQLTYAVSLPSGKMDKAFLDEIRTRNGNLNVVCGREDDRDLM